MRERGRSLRAAAIVAAIALAADQITKAIVRNSVEPGERINLLLGVDLVRVGNDGIAFGLFDEAGSAIVVAAAGAFALLLAYFLVSSGEEGLWLPIGLLAGGALGNLLDRVRDGFVTDFIDPPRWPAFNLADVEITVGVLLLLWMFLRPPADAGASGEGAASGEGGAAPQGPAPGSGAGLSPEGVDSDGE